MVKGLFVAHGPAATNDWDRNRSDRDHYRGQRWTSQKRHGRTDYSAMGR
ncbi:hypothetical protein [Saccharopolyspora sp. NPDC002376]